jgi:hypothetical protein
MKAACIYDINTPYTTGVYIHRGLLELGYEVDKYDHNNVKDIPEGYDFYFIVDSGPTYNIPRFLSGPSLYYSIDTHLDFENRLNMAKTATIPIMAQYTCGAFRATQEGLTTIWMPLGCDPWIHVDQQAERALDISFVGHLYQDDVWRQTIKNKLLEHGLKEEKIYIGEATKEDLSLIYSRSKIVLNHTVRDNKKDINMRVFEAMSCGAYLLTQRLDNNDMDQIFDPTLYAVYNNDTEMFQTIDNVLRGWEQYKKIAAKAKLAVRRYHTYAEHLKNLLINISQIKPEKNKTVN